MARGSGAMSRKYLDTPDGNGRWKVEEWSTSAMPFALMVAVTALP